MVRSNDVTRGMVVRINARRQIALPEAVMDSLGARPGDSLELCVEPKRCILLGPARVHADRLAPLRGKLVTGKGIPWFDPLRD
jgi:bifunctional DNA-binding transcriptional regulator/antitoxin component of YhaV-PrlF toxin-antitoxin module